MPSVSDFNLALEYLFKKKGQKTGIENSIKLATESNNPHKDYRVIHIAGTNGKGSVCTYLARILEMAGYRTGLFNSPHVDRFTERIRVNSSEIEKEFVLESIDRVKSFKHINPTFFEITTYIAFNYFKKMDVDIAVVETGVGGRFDATNIVDPELSIITTVGFDHEKTLGEDIEKIAFEKGGIIKWGKPVILGRMPSAAEKKLRRVALQRQAPVISASEDFNIEIHEDNSFNISSDRINLEGLKQGIPGDHMRSNAALSIIGSTFFDRVKETHIRQALKFNPVLPARSEKIFMRGRHILLDVCHNIDGAIAFCKMIRKYFKGFSRVHILAAIMRNKNYNDMISQFLSVSDRCILTTIDMEKCFNPDFIEEKLKPEVIIIKDLKTALDRTIEYMGENDILCVAGSFYLLDRVRKLLFCNK